MRKKVMGIIVAAVITVVAEYNMHTSQNEMKLSDLVLANVEALADGGEYPGSPNERVDLICAIWGKEMCGGRIN